MDYEIMRNLPTGSIVMWFGALMNIPDGFIPCDGTNGTPELRDKFIVGAGDTYDPDDTGGGTNHQHDFTSDGHDHTLPAGGDIRSGTNFPNPLSDEVETGTTDNASTLPPWKAIYFIEKTSD